MPVKFRWTMNVRLLVSTSMDLKPHYEGLYSHQHNRYIIISYHPFCIRTGFRSTSLAQFLESLTKDAAVVCLQEVKMTHQELQYDFCK